MIVALIIAFFSLILLMVIHELGHFVIAKKFGAKVEEFGLGYPPRLFGKKFGETLYSVNLIPLGAFVRIYGEEGGLDDYRSFAKLAIWQRILIVLGGVLAFWIASAVIFSVVFGIGASLPVGDADVAGLASTQVKVLNVSPGSPAALSGVKPGDVLLQAKASDGTLDINKISDLQKFEAQHAGGQITLILERSGALRDAVMTVRTDYPKDQGALGLELQRLGNVIDKHSWYEAPVRGVIYTGQVTWQSLAGIWQFFTSLFAGRGVPSQDQLAGPVGITIFLSEAASYGPGFFLYFIGSLSVLLAIFNLLPIPALDGGKLLFLIIEKIKGRPVSARVEQALTLTFFVLLICMSLFITVKFDFPRVAQFWQAGL